MSIINWQRRDLVQPRKSFDLRPGAVNIISADMMHDLDQALEEQQRREPLGTPTPRPRTARIISDEIEHLRNELAGARELVKQGEAKEATLVTELTKAVDDELAAKQAAHDADVAELESLRPATDEPIQKETTNV